MTLQAFISYKSEYRDFAERLRDSLLAWGHHAWLDVKDIHAGEDWDTAIHQGMKTSQIVIGVLTPESLRSDNVLDEWGWALSNQRRL
ncbi:MAG TPA: toll/interleukin-1 receptor domain-containing protein, partial [Phototrophicaceae bacterium]|nr:toll/interleukin-1 receptor domain-containing protein [Phototrophicaceae bacterium]